MSLATLVIMAAGIGSRFGGGIKQLEPIGPSGEIIMDYSIHDALAAGFDQVVFVIRKDLEKDFKAIIGRRIEKHVSVSYAYQEIDDIPQPYRDIFATRTKPWGTGQAILCCKDIVNSPFLVINADDYYGKQAYIEAYEYLTKAPESDEICMVGFVLRNTLSENGGVTRGICKLNEAGYLTEIIETHDIRREGNEGVVADVANHDGKISLDAPVSMNMWGLRPTFFQALESGFGDFLRDLSKDDLKAEYLLPTIVGELLEQKTISVKVLSSNDQWFGVTYKKDKEVVVEAIKRLIDEKKYTSPLF